MPADHRVAAGLASLTLALILGACGGASRAPEASPSNAPAPTGAPPTTTASPARAPRRPSPPVRVELPIIGVSSRLVRLGLAADGTMEVPRDYGVAGWFTGGPCSARTARR